MKKKISPVYHSLQVVCDWFRFVTNQSTIIKMKVFESSSLALGYDKLLDAFILFRSRECVAFGSPFCDRIYRSS